MIRYDLKCTHGHAFDSWFSSSEGYDEQVKAGLVSCPYCMTSEVEKAIMAPSIAKKSIDTKAAQKLRQALQLVEKHVRETHDYVGESFAEEARKIHYGEIPRREIYGEATLNDVATLLEEDIAILPLTLGRTYDA